MILFSLVIIVNEAKSANYLKFSILKVNTNECEGNFFSLNHHTAKFTPTFNINVKQDINTIIERNFEGKKPADINNPFFVVLTS